MEEEEEARGWGSVHCTLDTLLTGLTAALEAGIVLMVTDE